MNRKVIGAALLAVMSLPALLVAFLLAVPLFFLSPPTPAAADCLPGGPLVAGKIPNGWGSAVEAAAKVSGVPAPVLAAQLETESGWNPKAGSSAGAQGLAQFIPSTWEHYAPGKDPHDPLAAIAAQGAYMKDLMGSATAMAKSSGEDALRLALAGYNAGWGAVEQYHGIPPYAETQNYVVNIMAKAKTYASAAKDDKAPPTSCNQGAAAGDGDDLPWKDAPTWMQIGVTPLAASPLGFYNRECVDFALWRVNQQLGGTAKDLKVTNSTFRGDGVLLGSANTPPDEGGPYSWLTGWQVKGWPTGHTPKPGAVVYYAPKVGGSDRKYGHVAVVKSVNSDGTYVEEGYNGDYPPNDHKYYTRVIKNDVPTMFLYVPAAKKDYDRAA